MEYQPAKFITPSSTADQSMNAHLIILNQPISSTHILKTVWNKVKWKVCADGGANRLYDLFSDEHGLDKEQYLPDFIIGDLDSLRPDVEQYYRSQAVRIQLDGDQYSTDFGKSMKLLTRGYPHLPNHLICSEGNVRDIILMGTISGRLDQGIGLLHEMLRESRRQMEGSCTPVRLWLVSEQSVTFLLHPGKSRITDINFTVRDNALSIFAFHSVLAHWQQREVFTPNVGILPIYGPATISTGGLEWNVENWRTEMGGMVSTSNHVLGDELNLETDQTVLFTIEMNRKIVEGIFARQC